jgi:UDP-N-acetylmuramoyl-tripeptide--D-alanyl-D-alanine ligase
MTIEQLYRIFLQHPSVQTDSRKVKEGNIFFALKGPNFNGNRFAQKALQQGAAYAVIDEKEYAGDERLILSNNVLTTLQQLAVHHRKQLNIPVIAITGSNGKTTTKELVHAVLASAYKTFTTEGNLNNHIGIPLTLLRIRQDAEIAVIEMGANHLGEIAGYCKYALPTHGIITNAGKAHLEGFGGVEGVRKGKGELYDHLRSHKGIAFVMWDYDYLREMSRGITKIITYGTKDAQITGITASSDPFLVVKMTGGPVSNLIRTKLVGEYNLPNILAAVTVGDYFKVPENKIRAAIENYTPSNSRSQLLKKGANTIILDAYNANPSSMKAAIENFAAMEAAHKVLLLGAMAELGPESMAEHQAIINLLQHYKWDAVVLVGGDFLKTGHHFLSFETALQAGEWLHRQHFHDTTILVKGSRSMQMEKILDNKD